MIIPAVLFAFAAQNGPKVSYLDNGEIRVGIDLSKGGSITYLAKSKNGENIVNSFDLGREIQMSYYSGPIPFEPGGKKPNPDWIDLGWNPIQSGDSYGNPSRVVSFSNNGREIYVKCIPKQWPLDDVATACTFESWIHLEGKVAQVRNVITNTRKDLTQYAARTQELPAIYTNGAWSRLFSYTGDRPFTKAPATQLPSVFPWGAITATENWVALLNKRNEGVGVWEPGTYAFSGGFAGTPIGSGGPADFQTGYISPNQNEILDGNIVYESKYSLIVGSLHEIRDFVDRHSDRPRPPQYDFDRDRQHWSYVNASDTGWPISRQLDVQMKDPDPQLISPPGLWLASQAPVLTIYGAFNTSSPELQVFWTRFDDPNFSEEKSVHFNVIPDGKYRAYHIKLWTSSEYRGSITGLRVDPEPNGAPGDWVKIRSIGFGGDRQPVP